MIERLRARNEWKFAGVLPQADRALAAAWWTLLVLRGLLPALFAIAMGRLVGAVQRGDELAAPLGLVGVVFVLLQVLSPIHHAVGANLGSRTAAWLYDRLTTACVAPPGMGHLENPGLTSDLTMARDFDLGITGPPIFISMDFIAAGLVELVGGLASAVVLAAYAWWAPLLLAGAWAATHWLLRESAVWRDRETAEVREAQRHADYAYRLAVEPAPAAAVLRLRDAMAAAGALVRGERPAARMPAREIRFRHVTFAYPTSGQPVLAGFDLSIPAGSSVAIVGQNGAGKTTLAKLLCRLYDPQDGAIEVDGVDLRTLDVDAWRSRLTAVFQDFVRFELPLRDNVAPAGAPDDAIEWALAEAGAAGLAGLDTVLARAYPGGTDLSGGQWQRIALARALCAVRLGAGLVLLDEPTAQLDVRGEAEIFDRILAATRQTTTILISHRFSTVRHADRICVLEHGRVVELGTHDQLMSAGGRYRTMFQLQASRFGDDGEPGASLDVLD